MGKTYVIGDIHGAHHALEQVLGRAGFDRQLDQLICLGDVCDRRVGVKESVEILLGINNLVMILGNHDQWALEWMLSRGDPSIWLYQGGIETMQSYSNGIPESHIKLFSEAVYYYVDDNKLFVHGGIDPGVELDKQDPETFLWDRSLVYAALDAKDPSQQFTAYDEVFVGHTPTLTITTSQAFRSLTTKPQPEPVRRPDFPLRLCNVWLMDTGAGWSGGRLSLMNVETKETWQSDPLP